MRNLIRVLAVDVAAPAATVAALLMIGVMMAWPVWWIVACAVLCTLIAEAVIVNIVGYRRDSVTMGTDDDAPRLRLAAAAVTATALTAAAVIGYLAWTVPDREFTRDSDEVVRIATDVAEATATFTPADPGASIDRVTSMMAPDSAEEFKAQFTPATADLAKRRVTAQAQTISVGLEALGRSAASAAVLMRGTQTIPGEQPNTAVLALRVALAKRDGAWMVVTVAPLATR
ncbi:MAG: hypothetical protein ACR2JM_17530 [Mycobacterium sp.]